MRWRYWFGPFLCFSFACTVSGVFSVVVFYMGDCPRGLVYWPFIVVCLNCWRESLCVYVHMCMCVCVCVHMWI